LRDLRRERERRSLSLEEVSSQTRIPLRYLEALERGEPFALPAGPYGQSFRRQYENFLDTVDVPAPRPVAPKAIPRVDSHEELQPIEVERTTTGTIPRHEELPVARLLVTTFVLTVVILLSLKVGSALLDPSPPPSAGISAPLPIQTLNLRAHEPVKVELMADGVVKHSGSMTAGEQIKVEGRERIVVEASDLTALTISLDGELIEPLHNLTHPRRLVFVQDPPE
jgi:transcriptional regulator with XRE-family HTH domain